MKPIPIRKISYQNLKTLLEDQKAIEDQEVFYKVRFVNRDSFCHDRVCVCLIFCVTCMNDDEQTDQ